MVFSYCMLASWLKAKLSRAACTLALQSQVSTELVASYVINLLGKSKVNWSTNSCFITESFRNVQRNLNLRNKQSFIKCSFLTIALQSKVILKWYRNIFDTGSKFILYQTNLKFKTTGTKMSFIEEKDGIIRRLKRDFNSDGIIVLR